MHVLMTKGVIVFVLFHPYHTYIHNVIGMSLKFSFGYTGLVLLKLPRNDYYKMLRHLLQS